MTKKLKFVPRSVENIVGKVENAEKEKMLVTSIVSFSHNVFKRFLSQGRKSQDCVAKS